MKLSRLLSTSFLAVIVFFSVAVSSHHSVSPHFDTSKEIVIENAVVTEWKFVNPHAYLYFDVLSTNGEVDSWRCESSGATVLRRVGWTKETLKPGQKVTIIGNPAWREENVCSIDSIILENGTVIGRWENLADSSGDNGQFAVPETATIPRPATLDNGQPNISGNWVTLSFGRNRKGGQPPPFGRLQSGPSWGGFTLTDQGLELAENYDARYDDPSLLCQPINIISGWNHDIEINEIIQDDDKITLRYGFTDFVRTIYLNVDEHPENITASIGGHSIGKWQDDTLIVDSIGFKPGVLLSQGGVQHSENLHVVERFKRDMTSNELVREYTLSDPGLFVGLYEGVDYMRMTDEPYVPYDCLELSGKNNQRPSND